MFYLSECEIVIVPRMEMAGSSLKLQGSLFKVHFLAQYSSTLNSLEGVLINFMSSAHI